MFPRFSQFYKTLITEVLKIVETSILPLDFPGNDSFVITRLCIRVYIALAKKLLDFFKYLE